MTNDDDTLDPPQDTQADMSVVVEAAVEPTPRYGDVDSVPHHGPAAADAPPTQDGDGSYDIPTDTSVSDSTKRGYLEDAASRLEARTNDGHPIVNIERSHHFAANLYASYLLYHDLAHVASARRGSLDAEASDIRAYADDFKEEFDEVCADINTAAGDESGGPDDGSNDGASSVRMDLL
jgi:hypothetical protein